MNKVSVVIDHQTVSYWKYEIINRLHEDGLLNNLYITENHSIDPRVILRRFSCSSLAQITVSELFTNIKRLFLNKGVQLVGELLWLSENPVNFQYADNIYYFSDSKKILDPNLIDKNKPIYFISMTPFYHHEVDEYFVKKDKIEIINNENEETYFRLGSNKKSKILLNGKIIELNKQNTINSTDDIYLIDKKIIIEVLEGKIKFIKLGKQKKFNFPWNRKINVSISVNNNHKSINFKTPEIFDCRVNIVNDDDSSVLYSLSNCAI